MNQNKIIGLVLLVVGVGALLFGFNATNAPTEELTEAFTGQYSDQTMIYLIGGAAAAAVGAFMFFRK